MKDRNVPGSTWADTLPSQWGPEFAKIEIPLEGFAPSAPGAPVPLAAPAPVPARLPLSAWLRA